LTDARKPALFRSVGQYVRLDVRENLVSASECGVIVVWSALISVVGDVRKVSHGGKARLAVLAVVFRRLLTVTVLVPSSVLAVHRRGLLAVFSRRLAVHLLLQPSPLVFILPHNVSPLVVCSAVHCVSVRVKSIVDCSQHDAIPSLLLLRDSCNSG